MKNLIIKNGTVVFPSRTDVKEATIVISEGKIHQVIETPTEHAEIDEEDTEVINASGYYVSPGFIDLQVNGGAGADFLEADKQHLEEFSNLWASTGCTSFLATVITEDIDRMRSAMNAIVETEMTNFAGIHIEGPFISIEKKGTHDQNFIQEPEESLFDKLIEGFSSDIKLFTLAPELPNSYKLISKLEDLNIIPSLGHSSATFEEAGEGIEAGVKSFTHLYNGMTGLHHREPGCVGRALVSDAYTGLIVDGLHVHPAAIQIASRLKEPEKLYLVTDAISAAGLSEGTYNLGGQKIIVEGGIARLENGTISGSTLTMNEAVKNYMKFAGVDIPQAIQAATLTPAQLIGLDDKKGSIEKAKDADLVVFDDEVEVQKTIIQGDVVYDNGS